MTDLVRFKTATLTDIGFHRNGVWNEATAFQKIEHLGLLFGALAASRSEEHTSELQSLMRISYAVFCLKKKKHINRKHKHDTSLQNKSYQLLIKHKVEHNKKERYSN